MTEWIPKLIAAFSKPLKWWVVIAPWEQGALVRLGRTVRRLDPGPHLRIPFLDRIYVQSVRLRTITTSNQTVSTADGKTVTLSFCVQFAIEDVVALYNAVANPETTLRSAIEAAMSQEIQRRAASDLSPDVLRGVAAPVVEQFRAWGLGKIDCFVTSFALVKTFRFLSNEYSSGTGLWDLGDDPKAER